MDHALVSFLKSHHHTQGHLNFFLCYLLGFLQFCILYFQLIFVKGVWSVSRLIFLDVDIQFYQHHLLKRVSLLHCIAFAPVKGQLTIFMGIYFWVLYAIQLTYLSNLLSIPHCPDHCSFIVSLEVRQYQSSNFVLLLQYCVGFSESFASPYKFQKKLQISIK